MSASVFGSGFGGGGGGIVTPVSIAQGGTGQTATNAAFNALAAMILGQTATFALSDNLTNTAPVARVLSHASTGGTTAAGFGVGDAVDLQNAAGTLKRLMTDTTSLVVATGGAEEVRRDIALFVSGASQKCVSFGYLINGNNPTIYVGDPAQNVGMLRATGSSVAQLIYGTAQLQWNGSGLTSLSRHVFSGRLQQGQGASIASATTLTLGSDGNVFPISGTTGIQGIVTNTWSAGAVVYLKFAGILTVTHNSGAPGAGAVAIKTTTAANVTTAANSIMTLMYDGNFWVQTCPITPGY